MQLSDSNRVLLPTDTLEKIHLVFPDLRALWAFVESLSARNLEINTGKKTLTCFCHQQDISIAISKFKAIAIDEHVKMGWSSFLLLFPGLIM